MKSFIARDRSKLLALVITICLVVISTTSSYHHQSYAITADAAATTDESEESHADIAESDLDNINKLLKATDVVKMMKAQSAKHDRKLTELHHRVEREIAGMCVCTG